eukprot:827556-Prymnesium_polylepis.1
MRTSRALVGGRYDTIHWKRHTAVSPATLGCRYSPPARVSVRRDPKGQGEIPGALVPSLTAIPYWPGCVRKSPRTGHPHMCPSERESGCPVERDTRIRTS